MEDEAQVLEGGRLGQHMLPNMPRARSRAVEDHNLRLGGARSHVVEDHNLRLAGAKSHAVEDLNLPLGGADGEA